MVHSFQLYYPCLWSVVTAGGLAVLHKISHYYMVYVEVLSSIKKCFHYDHFNALILE